MRKANLLQLVIRILKHQKNIYNHIHMCHWNSQRSATFSIASKRQSLSFSSALTSCYQLPTSIRSHVIFLYTRRKYLLKMLFLTSTQILHYRGFQLHYTLSNYQIKYINYSWKIFPKHNAVFQSDIYISHKITIYHQSITIWRVLICGCHSINGLK